MIFKNFNFADFWEKSDYADKEYVGNYPTDEIIENVTNQLGYKLPESYIKLMKSQNGGIPNSTCYPTTEKTTWADNHIAIIGIMGIGNEKPYSLCGDFSSQFWIDEWDYPNSGIYICDCPSAGHDMIMLDYTNCGKNGEPEVVHVDQENNYRKTFLAVNFETFITGLVNEGSYKSEKQELIDDEDLEEEWFSDDF